MAEKSEKIKQLLERGVERIYPSKEALESVLESGKKLRLYNGIDPTGKLHIGHMVVLKKLRQFQNLGHEVIVLIGDFTAQIGDPSNKLAARKKITLAEVRANAKNYKNLIGKILDTKKSNVRFLHNQKWSNKLKPVDMLELASNFTVQQLIERDMFQKRIKNRKEIYLNEFLYPVFQAYDAVTMDVDLQVGGNDQTFNMLAGRHLMKKLKDKEKFVLSTKLFADNSGKKMGKSEGNIIALDDDPNEIFGKVMAFSDDLILVGLELLTDSTMSEIKHWEKEIGKEINPKDLKAKLAHSIVAQLYSGKEADIVMKEFERIFAQKELPTEIPEVKVASGNYDLPLLLINLEAVPSVTKARMLIEQGAVKVDEAKISDPKAQVTVYPGMVVQVGKRSFYKVK
ncbi:tyrosine--tRNA ligase [Candidatus Berkelbacteria bacterium RIFOXYA2_FULL_43_10]|uniref:Tyrosine--tRNA ligase n=1 Tax=Candidatus Berkelbacteria bacterium RIFOXYA2_FULL_43_10 TaxID=1797472 RepID=A0A1F5E9I5_9BACT|nr:MAG: tyrosine--tRNA ligase [Candidatus Berkelbacteria bacterium RIFOXYA2_FULL_43_10]